MYLIFTLTLVIPLRSRSMIFGCLNNITRMLAHLVSFVLCIETTTNMFRPKVASIFVPRTGTVQE